MADREQAASEADQRTSDRDQAAADRELEAEADPTSLRAHEQAKADRGEGTMARVATGTVREQVAKEREVQATHRDQIANRRDEAAASRDREAEEIDQAAEEMAGKLGIDSPAAKVAAVARATAAAARASAASDRERAARDREAAAQDRDRLIGELERLHVDASSGAFARRHGEVLLRHEVERAKGSSGAVVLALVSFEAADSASELYGALRARLRPYDPVVRWSESQFACTVAAVDRAEAERRLGDMGAAFGERHPAAAVHVSLAALKKGDTLDALVERAAR